MALSKTSPPQNFQALGIKLASPEQIREWSYGEVTKAETINYRTQRAERNGLFDERIFGPERDYECYCGKYRRIRYKDIICEKCGVEVTRSIVRRERMGHIELAGPVAHIWFLRGIPSRIATLLGEPTVNVEKVIYFSGYIVTRVNEQEKAKFAKELESEYKSKVKSLQSAEAKEQLKTSLSASRAELASLSPGRIVDEAEYHRLSLKYSSVFEAEIGPEAIYNIFRSLDLKKLSRTLEQEFSEAGSAGRLKIIRRLNLVKTLLSSGVRPEWMFLKVIPVIPPALRPMVALDGGRHATSDVNDLYRRVINRNNRLKKLLELKAPEVILRNEKRILQEAVDALIDNTISQRDTALIQTSRRPLKSLADNLKGKQGRFRQNLLGKRVDYSGRSVIVVGPELKLSECGLPKHMALELFRPFVVAKLLERELAFNIRGAGKLIDEGIPEVWEILEQLIRDKYVLLNRAPTLHRLGIQAFRPVLIEGNAIQVHPLVCKAFNADFDGDQMAVHVPLSQEAQSEAKELMASAKNLLGPGNNEPIVSPSLDIVLGCYFITKLVESQEKDQIRHFSSPNEAILAYDHGIISARQKIKVLATASAKYAEFGGEFFETSVGRLLFNSILPEDFPYLNKPVKKTDIAGLVEELIYRYGIEATPPVLDKIKSFGFAWAKRSGITWGIDDVSVPADKGEIVKAASQKIHQLEENFSEGLISAEERHRLSIEIWQTAKSDIEKLLQQNLDPAGPVTDMLSSGARGALVNVSQMVGMKGLIVNPAGEVFNFPIIPSYKEGLSPIEYFVSTHGARKGLADTALKTAKAGYLTRRLVYVADNAIVTEEDCGDDEGRLIESSDFSVLEPTIMPHLRGRVLAADVKNNEGKLLYKKGALITKRDAFKIAEAGVTQGRIRSPLSCRTLGGICRLCYGLDLTRNRLVEIGEAVGVIAAQATGEPGTQLTMRTFHTGGIASAGGDITMGLPRVEEIFERRIPKNSCLLSEVAGTVAEVKNNGQDRIITILTDKKSDKKGKAETVDYTVSPPRSVIVKKGDQVEIGTFLSDGPADLRELFRLAGRVVTERYIISEIHRIYEMQGASIDRKHIEVIVRQMFSRRRIIDPGGSRFVIGEIIEQYELEVENVRLVASAGQLVKAEEIIVGISDAALTTASVLAAASFENTQRILTAAAIAASVDTLKGIKENVILGRLIPAGPHWRKRQAGGTPLEVRGTRSKTIA